MSGDMKIILLIAVVTIATAFFGFSVILNPF